MVAIALAFAAALCLSSAAIFARVGLASNNSSMTPMAGSLISLVFSLVPAVPLALIFAWDDFVALPAVGIAWLLGLGALNNLGGRTLGLFSIVRLGASRTIAILGTASVFAAIFAVALGGERPHAVVLLGTVVVVAGLAVMLGPSLLQAGRTGRTAYTGYLICFAAAGCLGGTNVLAKHLTGLYGSPLMISAMSMFFGMLLVAPLGARDAQIGMRETRTNPRSLIFIALMGLATAGSTTFLYYTLREGAVTLVSPIVFSSPLLTIAMSVIFLRQLETINRWLIMGATVIVTGVVLVVIASTW